VKMMLEWKPVALKGSLSSGGYLTPIGVMRLHFQSARNLRNLETMGKSDPYVRVLLSGVEKGRTVTFKNNLDPDWDEVVYVPVHTIREKLTFEVMDEEKLGKDRSLGHVELTVADYAKQGDNDEWLPHEQRQSIAGPLRLSGSSTPKGTLNYTCSFYPTIPTFDPDEEDSDEEEEKNEKDDLTPPNGLSRQISNQTAGSNLSTKHRRTVSGASAIARSETAGTISSMVSKDTTNRDSAADLAKQLEKNENLQDESIPEKKVIPKLHLSADEIQQYGTLRRNSKNTTEKGWLSWSPQPAAHDVFLSLSKTYTDQSQNPVSSCSSSSRASLLQRVATLISLWMIWRTQATSAQRSSLIT
jgi:hypothetical protein